MSLNFIWQNHIVSFWCFLIIFSLCIQKKTFQLNWFDFIFLSQHDLSQNFSSLQKKVCLNFVVIKLSNKMYYKLLLPNFLAKVFFLTNYLVTKQWLLFFFVIFFANLKKSFCHKTCFLNPIFCVCVCLSVCQCHCKFPSLDDKQSSGWKS